jgi:hypothetical protein
MGGLRVYHIFSGQIRSVFRIKNTEEVVFGTAASAMLNTWLSSVPEFKNWFHGRYGIVIVLVWLIAC